MNKYTKVKSIVSLLSVAVLTTACTKNSPQLVTVNGVAQNPEGIEYNKIDDTFLLSSINAKPIIKVKKDGTFTPFTKGEAYPLSTAGLQIDYKNNKLLVAGFNGTELMDKDPKTKGTAHLRVYDLTTGELQDDIDLSHLVPDAQAFFANDIAVDNNGNIYITDWYAKVIYKVDNNKKATLFWKNDFSIVSGGANGIDFHPDGYLLVSLLTVNEKGLYDNYALVKVPLDNPTNTTKVEINDKAFSGFDGMVINSDGDIIGVTNNQKTPGGNTLIKLSSDSNWKSANIIHKKDIPASTTVAITPENDNYVINQDFTKNFSKKWLIQQSNF
jgi:sugar lactone lactonase YvrE